MNKNKWSGYAKYLVLASNSNGKLRPSFTAYLEFKKLKEVINNIAFSDKSTYSSSGDIYIRKITSSEAKNILDNIEECKWTSTTAKIILVANQLKIRI
jgi:hypothetical protein|tara:strand:+ start:464 stop:757 length:294 start_codon:yes stop_codon:yes gene_type:complete